MIRRLRDLATLMKYNIAKIPLSVDYLLRISMFTFLLVNDII